LVPPTKSWRLEVVKTERDLGEQNNLRVKSFTGKAKREKEKKFFSNFLRSKRVVKKNKEQKKETFKSERTERNSSDRDRGGRNGRRKDL